MSIKFKDDEPITCDVCGEVIYAPSTYYEYNDSNCCSHECVGALMCENHADEIIEHELLTAEDHEAIYGDMEYDRRKDEGYYD